MTKDNLEITLNRILDKYKPMLADSDLDIRDEILPPFDETRKSDYSYCVSWGDAKRLELEKMSFERMVNEIDEIL